jgi:shikimate dehydrogenase
VAGARERYHESVNALPDRYGVIGHPVSHSWSPFIHGMFARQTEQDIVYRLHEVPPERFRGHVLEFFTSGGRGLNVTVPHKIAAAELANDLTPRAERAGAVNTLMLLEDKFLVGDNTDGAGLVNDLLINLRLILAQRRILIIGAGGASRGVLAPLLMLKPSQILIANRTVRRAETLAADFSDLGTVRACGFDEIPLDPFDIIINATSASLSGEIPAITRAVVDSNTVCYDMAYGKSETPFLNWALASGCARAVQGLGMLVEQAAASFELWRGIRPQTAPVLAALQKIIQER